MAHGLTLDDVATQIRIASLELPSGGVKTANGEILVRVADRKRSVEDFNDLIIRSSFQGAELRLGDIATITDGYTDTDEESYYNGKRAVRLVVYRVGDQTPTDVATAVKKYKTQLQAELPETITVSVWNDTLGNFERSHSVAGEQCACRIDIGILYLGVVFRVSIGVLGGDGDPHFFLWVPLFCSVKQGRQSI